MDRVMGNESQILDVKLIQMSELDSPWIRLHGQLNKQFMNSNLFNLLVCVILVMALNDSMSSTYFNTNAFKWVSCRNCSNSHNELCIHAQAFDSLLHRCSYSNFEINGKTQADKCEQMGVQNHIEISGQPINNLQLMRVYTIPSCAQVKFRMFNSYEKDHVKNGHLKRNLVWFQFHRPDRFSEELRTPLS